MNISKRTGPVGSTPDTASRAPNTAHERGYAPRTVRILGTHGVPATYGGFETAAENIGLYLRDRGWRVVVYCQLDGDGPIEIDEWNGLERVMIRESEAGLAGNLVVRSRSRFGTRCQCTNPTTSG